MKKHSTALLALTALCLGAIPLAQAKPVGITPDKMSATVRHNGQNVEIKRDQDNNATVIAVLTRPRERAPHGAELDGDGRGLLGGPGAVVLAQRDGPGGRPCRAEP